MTTSAKGRITGLLGRSTFVAATGNGLTNVVAAKKSGFWLHARQASEAETMPAHGIRLSEEEAVTGRAKGFGRKTEV